MRISQLVQESGVPLATVKYYLREGLLMPGASTASRQAEYGEDHLHRLRVIRALTGTAALSVQQARAVLALIDDPGGDLFETLGSAVAALSPNSPDVGDAEYPRARAVIERLGQVYDPRYAAVAQLERALEAAEQAGLPISASRIDAYGSAIRSMAEYDITQMPNGNASASVEYAVLGTALYEPVIAALRRLAHQDVAARTL